MKLNNHYFVFRFGITEIAIPFESHWINHEYEFRQYKSYEFLYLPYSNMYFVGDSESPAWMAAEEHLRQCLLSEFRTKPVDCFLCCWPPNFPEASKVFPIYSTNFFEYVYSNDPIPELSPELISFELTHYPLKEQPYAA